MPGMPELPVDVDPTVRQEFGDTNTEPIYQTHRGKPARRDVGDLPPAPPKPDVPLRYAE